MFRIIRFEENELWDKVVKSFPNYDVYYLNGYLDAFHIHGDGSPILVCYTSEHLRGICAYMLRDVAQESWARDSIPVGSTFDVVTPYGYGGFLFDGDTSEKNKVQFFEEYNRFMQENHIVCAFTRWHPLLQNQDELRGFSNVIDLGHTIDIDTSSEEIIMQNIHSKDRSTIRKAVKNGIIVKHSKESDLFSIFMDIYNQTMDKDNAIPYYYFKKEFYDSIVKNLEGNYEMFYAELDGKIIAMSIMLFCNKMMHYHLSGSILEYRRLNATNLILYEAAVFGARNGYKRFHLGGGVGSGEDPLFKFKKSFNKNSGNQFSISKDIFDEGTYQKLVFLRQQKDDTFNNESGFFPKYRA